MNTLASIKWINVLWETDNIDFLPPNFVFLVTDRSRKTGKFNVNNHYKSFFYMNTEKQAGF